MAVPPDVRWRLCPTVSMFLIVSGAAPHAIGGIAPKSKKRVRRWGQSHHLTSAGKADRLGSDRGREIHLVT